MRTRTTKVEASKGELLKRIAEFFAPDCYRGLRGLFEMWVSDAAQNPNALRAVGTYLEEYERTLQRNPGDRFQLDSWIVRDIAETWSNGPVKLSPIIIPVYGKEWAFGRMNALTPQQICALMFRGADALTEIDLLEYPWLCHELGHAVLTKGAKPLNECIENSLADWCRSLRKQGIADSRFGQLQNDRRIDRVKQVWSPTSDQKNWAHELAVDLIALWTTGPAFLACFQDTIEFQQPDPFKIDSEHPAYLIRIRALIDGATILKWDKYAAELRAIFNTWKIQSQEELDHNLLVTLGDDQIVTGITQP